MGEIPFLNWGMLENLVSELLGIIITVLIVDQLIRRREEKRLEPIRSYFQAEVLHKMTYFIFDMTNFKELPQRGLTLPSHLHFLSTPDYSKVTDEQQIRDAIKEKLPAYSKEPRHSEALVALNRDYRRSWKRMVKTLRKLAGRFPSVVEPELLDLFLNFELSVYALRYHFDSDKRWEREEVGEDEAIEVIRAAISIYSLLSDKVSPEEGVDNSDGLS